MVHGPRKARVQLRPGDIVEHLAQERIGLGQLVNRGLTLEHAVAGFVIAPGGEQAVADRLRVHIGELRRFEIVQQNPPERLELLVQRFFGLFRLERLADDITQDPGRTRHALRQIAWSGQDRKRRPQEKLAQLIKTLRARLIQNQFLSRRRKPPETSFGRQLPGLIQTKLEVVRQDQIW